MKIAVIASSTSLSVVDSEELDELLQKNAVLAFRRSDGWVRVGFDDIRDPGGRRGSSWKDRKTLLRQKSLVQIQTDPCPAPKQPFLKRGDRGRLH